MTSDPLYKEFLDFKNEMVKKLGHALELEKAEKDDTFYFRRAADPFFGGAADDGPSWNTANMPSTAADGLSYKNRAPSFYFNVGTGFSI